MLKVGAELPELGDHDVRSSCRSRAPHHERARTIQIPRYPRHAIHPLRLTGSFVARYAAPMRDQWKQGLQWGGVAWLGYLLWHTIGDTWGYYSPVFTSRAVLWAASALALALGIRYARAVLGGAILFQIITGTLDAMGYGGDMPIAWALKFWLPMTLGLVPLLFMAPERPRLTVALALVGRWRDAYATLAGWRWILVAYVVVYANHEAGDLLLNICQGSWGRFWHPPVFEAALLVLAAVPRERATSSAA